MPLTVLTVLAGAALGGGVAVDLTALVAIAVVALVAIALINGVRMVARVVEHPPR